MHWTYILSFIYCMYTPTGGEIKNCEQPDFAATIYTTECDTVQQVMYDTCALRTTYNQAKGLEGELTPYGCGFRMLTEVKVDSIQSF